MSYLRSTAARIAPLEPPYDPEVEATLLKWMPPNSGLEPLALFRTLARHRMLSERMRPLGAGLLSKGTLAARVRELLILRTSARCGARYEWGVHVTAFSMAAGLDEAIVQATAVTEPAQLAARTDDDGLVLRLADELHDASTLSDALFAAVADRFGETAVLEMCAVAGFYHLIAFLIGAARVAPEPWAAPFPGGVP
jgi:alkylhydroperoxidase family enzyme